MDVGSRRAAIKPCDLEQIERLIDEFEDAYQQGLQPSIGAFHLVGPVFVTVVEVLVTTKLLVVEEAARRTSP